MILTELFCVTGGGLLLLQSFWCYYLFRVLVYITDVTDNLPMRDMQLEEALSASSHVAERQVSDTAGR